MESTHRLIEPQALPARRRDAHKGDSGHLLVVGGHRGFAGAARLAGEAALRTGAGLVSVACHPESLLLIGAGRPELMVHAVDSASGLHPLCKRADVIVIGPGLGTDTWARGLLGAVLEQRGPRLFDADALNLLAQEPPSEPLGGECILTPHPAEAARLLGLSLVEVQADRPAAIAELQARYGGTWVLKGAGSLVLGEAGLSRCDLGNPGMAVGGMGDLLSGVIGALMAQGIEPAQAAEQGVWLHARAGDCAAAEGERGMLPSDLLPQLRALVNGGGV